MRNLRPFTYGIFNDAFFPIMDGVSLTVKNYAYWLNKRNEQVSVITPAFPGYTDIEEFPVIRYFSLPVPGRAPYRMGFPQLDPDIHTRLANLSFRLVHTHSPFSSGTLALKIAKSRNIPVIATFHSKYKDDFLSLIPNKLIVRQMIKSLIHFYDAVDEVWIPQAKVEETIREYGFKGKVQVVENGIDLQCQGDIERFRMESRKQMGISKDALCFLYVGQHIWEKNLRFLLLALKEFKGQDFIALFVGEGYAKAEMEKMVTEFGLQDKIKFIGPVYDREKLKKIYASADLFLFPSLYDNAPLVLREAAAFGTPALLLEGSTASEVIHCGENGFQSPFNLEEYVRRMEDIVADRKKLKVVGRNASASLCRSWEDVMAEVTDRYTALEEFKQQKQYFVA